MANHITISQAILFIKHQLNNLYPEPELTSLAEMVMENVTLYTRFQLHTNANEVLEDSAMMRIAEITRELKIYKPIQYILGKADFYDSKFIVNEAVLIPRKETEELVDWIIKSNKKNAPEILDLGTGSGCIAICLAKKLNGSKVKAVDLSQKALEVAKENATELEANIDFIQADMLQENQLNSLGTFDIIVSNPPYIRNSERMHILPNVVNYEPQSALFVSDDEALVFYESIARFAKKHLAPAGCVYVEFNEALPDETKQVFLHEGFTNVEIRKDINGKFRMLKAD